MSNIFEKLKDIRYNFRSEKVKRNAAIFGVIASMIFSMNCMSSNQIAYATENEKEVAETLETTVYRIDDLRNLLGFSRVSGEKNRQSIIIRANSISVSDKGKEKLLECLGSTKSNVEQKIVTSLKYANNAVRGMRSSMSKGYSAETVLRELSESKDAIKEFEKESGIAWTDNTADTEEKILADAEQFKNNNDANGYIGNNIGLSLQLPIQGEVIAVAESAGAGKVVIKNSTNSIQEVSNLFNGTVTKCENGEIVISNNEILIVTYSGDIETEVNVGDSVKQGQNIGSVLIDAEVGISISIDDKLIDPLKLFGSNGASMKREYINTHSDNGAREIKDYKDYPDMDNLIQYIDDGSIDAQYIE